MERSPPSLSHQSNSVLSTLEVMMVLSMSQKMPGQDWEKVSGSLPQNFWVSQVSPSSHAIGRVYVSLNGYRWDNFEAMIYISNNFGKSWTRIGTDLPKEPVNVIKEDPVNENVVYVGTDHGVYVSLDQGQTFQAFNEGLPNTPVHDLVVHPRENDLVVGNTWTRYLHWRHLPRSAIGCHDSCKKSSSLSCQRNYFQQSMGKQNMDLGRSYRTEDHSSFLFKSCR